MTGFWVSASLLTTVLVILASAGTSAAMSARKKQSTGAFLPLSDLLARAVIQSVPVNQLPILMTIVWIFLSSVAGVFLPYAHRPEFFGHADALLSTVDYTLVVPLLLGAYVFLLVSARAFLADESLEALGLESTQCDPHDASRRRRRRVGIGGAVLLQITLAGMTILIQSQAMDAAAKSPLADSPWVEATYAMSTAELQPQTNGVEPAKIGEGGLRTIPCETEFNVYGAVYYSVRGIDTYLALGLFVACMFIWWEVTQRLVCRSPEAFLTSDLRTKPIVTQFGSAIACCIVLATVATTLHGVVLLIHGAQLDSRAERIAVFLESTWLIWVILNVISTAFGAATLFWMHDKLVKGARVVEEAELERVEINQAFFELSRRGDTTSQATKEALEVLDRYWSVRGKLRVLMDRIDTWPLPRGVFATVGISILAQAVNIVGAVIALY